MMAKASGAKGLKTEELIRAYFLRAGFFVMRGIKLRHDGIELTDIDMWVYERSATLARRRTIIDIKDKKTPQAAERLFFVKGVASVIAVEGAGVATTDNRPMLRELARKHGVLWIDGADLQRLKDSDALSGLNRMTEEEFISEIADIDNARNGRVFRDKIDEVKSAVADRFGPSCANTALEGFQLFAREVVNAHPASAAARGAGRLSYLSAAIAAAAFDFASADTALRPTAERVRHMTDAVRFGANTEGALANLRWTEAAIREYLPNGAGLAQVIREKFTAELNAVPAEGLAEIVIRLSNSEKLFSIAKSLEKAAYASHLVSFDHLDADTKGFLGALLDFADISRPKFADGWIGRPEADTGGSGRFMEVENGDRKVSDKGEERSDRRETPPAPGKNQRRLL
ncbi:hypothetical protein NKI54_33935 [Mesorhizobium sp. M0663]|uniref:hypothetical protein n=1 Tax=Mesorhizobium sp. M0663 TaxID=2956981 RepID=UPI0033367E8A